jgi:hypothetical protein
MFCICTEESAKIRGGDLTPQVLSPILNNVFVNC